MPLLFTSKPKGGADQPSLIIAVQSRTPWIEASEIERALRGLGVRALHFYFALFNPHHSMYKILTSRALYPEFLRHSIRCILLAKNAEPYSNKINVLLRQVHR